MVEEKLRNIDRTTVDKYPIFEGCETVAADIISEKECFIRKLNTHVTTSLWQQQLVLHNEIDVTLQLTIEVNTQGRVLMLSHNIPAQLFDDIPEIEHYLAESITTLPEVKPALKKLASGELVAVRTRFTIPIHVVGKLPITEDATEH